jgi:hypothetical protein
MTASIEINAQNTAQNPPVEVLTAFSQQMNQQDYDIRRQQQIAEVAAYEESLAHIVVTHQVERGEA